MVARTRLDNNAKPELDEFLDDRDRSKRSSGPAQCHGETILQPGVGRQLADESFVKLSRLSSRPIGGCRLAEVVVDFADFEVNAGQFATQRRVVAALLQELLIKLQCGLQELDS